jgi:heme o synthase
MASIIPVKKEAGLLRTWKFSFINYIDILKPRETALLAVIGICSAIIASAGQFSVYTLALATAALVLGSAGCNGLTNFLDRDVDARMDRTKNRVLPLHRIDPPQKALPLIGGLLLIALTISWFLNPICFILGLVGIAASSLWRKTITCTIFGIIAGVCPVLIGWFAVSRVLTPEIILICLLVALWIPVHVWSIMTAKRVEYLAAGLSYFPLKLKTKTIATILFILSVLLYAVSILLYVIPNAIQFHLIYLIAANVLGIAMIVAVGYFYFRTTSKIAWRVYKLSSFPYLGIIFLVMVLDLFIR